uniref:Uncharacterized protein n=1 Tax=Arundo donax TaxID=35708 RepID=A0A0A8ZS27_ARUDO
MAVFRLSGIPHLLYPFSGGWPCIW